MAYKVFTNGSTLQASELNTNLMQQSVATFSNAAARSAAITTPVEGQLTYLEDVDRYEHWNGSSWRSPFGSTLITNTSFTSSTQVIISNCFSAAYDVYKIYLLPSAGGTSPILQMRTGATTQTSLYEGSVVLWGGGSVTGANRGSTGFNTFGNSARDVADITISHPFSARTTSYLALGQQTGSLVGMDAAFLNNTTSYESLVVNFTSSTTGNIAIYGMRK